MEALLTCAICKEGLKDPRSLPCLHSFCLDCLSPLASQAKDHKASCPLCRSPFEVPQGGGIRELPTDYFISTFLASPAAKVQDQNDVRCELCEEGREAESFCQQCDQFFCSPCQKSHSRAKSSQTHTFLSLEDYFKAGKGGGERKAFCHLPPTKRQLEKIHVR